MAVDTPASGPPPPVKTARPRSRNRLRLWVAAGVVVVAIAFLLTRALGDAATYFYLADEAVEKKADLGDRRIRVEGVVVDGSVRPAGDGVEFQIEENGVTVDVRHRNDPPELFQPDIPVVLEGRWQDDVFASDLIMVRHTSEYRAENPERLDR